MRDKNSSKNNEVLQDRRQQSRTPISIAVKNQCVGSTTLAQAIDINVDGMLLAQNTESAIPRGTRCWLEFSLPCCGSQIRARAEVVHHARHRRYQIVGVRFRTIAPSHKRLIDQYVHHPPEGFTLPEASLWHLRSP
jgi:c-di-GMP-binding flagellar brake protein YcgR